MTLRAMPVKSSFAPIAVFTFKRPGHTDRCLYALEKCPEFASSPVYVFIDGPRSDSERADTERVARIVEHHSRGRYTVLRREHNMGLANSIITEVSRLLDIYKKIIVIEDDLVVQPTILSWFNNGLTQYADDQSVFQISGYQYRCPEFRERNEGTFQNFTTTWGWATWSRAWAHFDPKAVGWEAISLPSAARRHFDADDSYPFSDMLVQQVSGRLDSWGIRWSWSMHKAGGLCLMPPRSLVENHGMGRGGTHNSVGILKQWVSGPSPDRWTSASPPGFPREVSVAPGDVVVFQRALRATNAKRNAGIKAVLSMLGINLGRKSPTVRLPRVLVVGQLPPPVTGLTHVTQRVVEALRQRNVLFGAINTAPPKGLGVVSTARYRIWNTLSSIQTLADPTSRSARTVYMTLDGGLGRIYNALIIATSRIFGYRLWIHHHSFAYVNKRSALMPMLLRLSPKATTHIFLCKEMLERFEALYENSWTKAQCRGVVLGNAFTVEPQSRAISVGRELTIGHMSNLTVAKGALEFIALFRHLKAAGNAVSAIMAGPAQEQAVQDAIAEVIKDFPDSFSWWGPVNGERKSAFFSAIDVFVFPTAYANEAQPVVLLEALSSGLPILTTKRGCISCDHSTAPGLVANEDSFMDEALSWLQRHSRDEIVALADSAQKHFLLASGIATEQLDQMTRDLVIDHPQP